MGELLLIGRTSRIKAHWLMPEASRSVSNRRPTLLEILEERLAEGDLSEVEYRERKRMLLEEDLERRAER